MKTTRIALGALGAVSLLITAAPERAHATPNGGPEEETAPIERMPPRTRQAPPPYYRGEPYYPPPAYGEQHQNGRQKQRRFARPHFLLGAEGVAMVFLGEAQALKQNAPESRFFDHGGGFRIFLGGRMTERFELQLSWQETWHSASRYEFRRPFQDGIVLGAFALDFKFYPWIGRVQPYLVISPTGYMLQRHNWSVEGGGLGFGAGGGLDIFLVEGMSVGAQVNYQGIGLFDYNPRGDDIYISALAFRLNLTGRF